MTDNELLIKLKEFYLLNNRSPYKSDFSNKSTYQRRFGSWNKALELANLPTNRISSKIWVDCKNPGCAKKTKGIYCSTSCSNKNRFKKPRKNRVKERKEIIRFESKTLEECIYSNDANRYGRVREHARRKFKPELEKGCQICNFVHAEVCHKQPISSFSLETKISEINNKSNILILCPNHHWLFDRGFLDAAAGNRTLTTP